MAHLKRFVQASKNSRTTMYAKIFFAFQITPSKPFSVFLARECDGSSEAIQITPSKPFFVFLVRECDGSSEAIYARLKIKEHKNGKI